MKTTYTPVKRLLPPRWGILVVDAVGRRTFWYRSRAAQEAVMETIRKRAEAER